MHRQAGSHAVSVCGLLLMPGRLHDVRAWACETELDPWRAWPSAERAQVGLRVWADDPSAGLQCQHEWKKGFHSFLLFFHEHFTINYIVQPFYFLFFYLNWKTVFLVLFFHHAGRALFKVQWKDSSPDPSLQISFRSDWLMSDISACHFATCEKHESDIKLPLQITREVWQNRDGIQVKCLMYLLDHAFACTFLQTCNDCSNIADARTHELD